jgi:hypothetical protein
MVSRGQGSISRIQKKVKMVPVQTTIDRKTTTIYGEAPLMQNRPYQVRVGPEQRQPTRMDKNWDKIKGNVKDFFYKEVYVYPDGKKKNMITGRATSAFEKKNPGAYRKWKESKVKAEEKRKQAVMQSRQPKAPNVITKTTYQSPYMIKNGELGMRSQFNTTNVTQPKVNVTTEKPDVMKQQYEKGVVYGNIDKLPKRIQNFFGYLLGDKKR